MVARTPAPEQALQASDLQTRLKAVRALRNQIIGNKFKKLQHLHLIPLILELVGSSSDADLQVQSIATLGSLVYGVEDGVRAIVAANGIQAIVSALESNDQRVVVAAARSLKLLYQSLHAPHEPLLAAPTLQRLVALLQEQSLQGAVATAAASVLAHCCTSPEEAAKTVAVGAVPALVPLLTCSSRSCQEAALEALAAVTQHSRTACQELLAMRPPAPQPAELQATPSATSAPDKADAAGSTSQQLIGVQDQQKQKQKQQQQQQQQREEAAAQQQCLVLSQLLDLSKQRDVQLRCLVASCLGNFFSPAGQAVQASAVNEELQHAVRVVLPHLVRLLPAVAAVAGQAAETLEFITKHTHHPHYPTLKAAGGGKARAEAAMLEAGGSAGDQACLQQVPKVVARLVGDREEFVTLAVELDAVKQLMAVLNKTACVAAAAAAHTSSSKGDSPAGTATDSSKGPAALTTSATPGHATPALSAAAAAKRARAAAATAAAAGAAMGILQLRQGSLQALAGLAVSSETARQQMVDSRLVPMLVAALTDVDAGVRLGAASTLRGLSRSVRILRGPALTPNLATPLVAMLQDSSSCGVQLAAAAAVCNLSLDFSNVCAALVEAGLPPALNSLLSSMLPELRLKALWAFKNLAFDCEPELQQQLLQELSWPVFRELLTQDDDPRVRAQAVGLLQNLCKGGDSIQQVLHWSDNQLLPLLEQQLSPDLYRQVLDAATAAAGPASSSATGSSSIGPDAAQVDAVRNLCGLLYTTSNVCSGSEQHKAAIMDSKVPQLLLSYIQLNQSLAATAAATAGDGGGGGGSSRSGTPARLSPGRGTAAAAAAGVAGTNTVAQGPGRAPSSAAADSAAVRAVASLALPAVWCIINLLWCDEELGAAAAGPADGASTPPRAQQSASAAAGAARSRGAGSSQGEGDVAMAAADEAGVGEVRAAVAARAAALKGLGFEDALKGLLDAQRGVGAQAAGAVSPDGRASQGAAVGLAADGDTQDLIERVQTALQQLGVSER